MLQDLPAEIIQEIALYIASFPDLIAYSLTNKYVYDRLQTGVIHRQRMINAGWDVRVWDFENPQAEPEGMPPLLLSSLQEYWHRSDHLHAQLECLLEIASKGNNTYFFHATVCYPMERRPLLPALSFTTWGSPFLDYALEASVFHKYDPQEWGLWEADIETEGQRVIDGQKIFEWMVNVGEVLPMVLVQHRSKNVPRLLQTEYMTMWTLSLRMLIGLAFSPVLTYGLKALEDDDGFWDLFHANALERFSFSVFYLSLLSDPGRLSDEPLARLDFPAWFALIDRYFLPTSKDFVASLFSRHVNPNSSELVSRRFAACFLIQTLILITVQCHHDFASDPESPFEYLLSSLTAPTPEDVMEWGASALWSDSPNDFRHGIAGTFFDNLEAVGPDTMTEWEGYYLNQNGPYWQEDPPAAMKLFLVIPSTANPDPSSSLYHRTFVFFNMIGEDNEGTLFRSRGRCDTRAGTVSMHRLREDGKDRFEGIISPFGMAGRWDDADGGENGGWWFVWPKDTLKEDGNEEGSTSGGDDA
ncbi:hypothetical protein OF83DRAFT_1082166 [Amylostereum chailletii]|nr:hypothetical protein OF83DRAFT_1082166 [Amylostereum chailletii]